MNQTITTQQARQLIERFYRCQTSEADEQALRRFLLSPALPPDLSDDARVILAMTEPALPSVSHEGRRWLRPLLRVAAVVAVAAIGGAAYLQLQTARLEARYGGSYVIENGRRTDNLRRIHRQIEQTLALADADYDPIHEAEAEMLQAIDDPDLRRRLDHLLDE